MRIWMHPCLPRRNLRIVIHRWGSLSCAWRPTDSELHRWPVDPTSGNVKLLLPPRQSRGNSHYGLVGAAGYNFAPDIITEIGDELRKLSRLHFATQIAELEDSLRGRAFNLKVVAETF